MSAGHVRDHAHDIHICIYTVPQIIYLTLYHALAYEYRAVHYFRNCLRDRKDTKNMLEIGAKKQKKFPSFKLKQPDKVGLEWFQRNIRQIDDHIELYESRSESEREEGWSEDSSD